MKNVVINEFAWLIAFKVDKNDPELIFGEGVQVEPVSHIAAVRRVVIDSDVYISSRVFISDNTHVFDDINTPIALQPIRFNSEVYIGKGSWIGQNVCIIGAKIGKNCFIMPNSVVLNDIPDYSVASGAPAVVVNIV
ncbi:MAG: acyltransferase [Candidatus Omnitrophota bacterium]